MWEQTQRCDRRSISDRSCVWSVAFIVLTASRLTAEEVIDFDREIRPILADNCYACHGPDEQAREGSAQEGLRLDTKEGAFAPLGDGRFAIVPGQPDESELVRRVLSTDDSEVMPPSDHRKSLTQTQRTLLAEWVRQGAEWSGHWAYTLPERATPPEVTHTQQVGNWIDRFILALLEQKGIEPSVEADRRTLIRRVSFDLIGLPPSREEVEAFVNDKSEQAWERLVDRLLMSPHFGERMAMSWLDLVRYADSVGYHGDQPVSVSPYRDYVIGAFNHNMPFDQFTRDQLAGDLLPDPTKEQLIASGYNKLGMMSAEGGVQDKEYLAKYAADRVRNAASVWMGSTLGCAECHDHKFDPYTTRDFYRFAAFFADIKERGLYSGAHADGQWGPNVEVVDDVLSLLLASIDPKLQELQAVMQAVTPELTADQEKWKREALVESSTESGDVEPAMKLPDEIRDLLKIDAAERTEEQQVKLAAHHRSITPLLEKERKQIAELTKRRDQYVAEHTRTSLITVSVEPREMRVLPRGNWMDGSGEVVQPGVPGFLSQIEKDDRATRLDLADWLTADSNPLTARVFVNRLWKLYFGSGLSKVLDDVGAQGEPPLHPKLLDTLAVEFVESGWNVKHMTKLIVMSRMYRQSSIMRDELRLVDPYNRLLARQSRYRLDAEMIRDNALAVSGLLVRTIGGRSAKPYQPAGLYRHLNFPAREYQQDNDENQYRRGVYTHWQRQFLHPAMQSFDAPSREECTAERPRSNTPLAALVLLNDPSYVEAARVFAAKALRADVNDDRQRVVWIMRHALSRETSEEEWLVLNPLLNSQRQRFADHPEAAKQIITTGLSPTPDDLDTTELAAWTSVTRTVFNMHEFIARN